MKAKYEVWQQSGKHGIYSPDHEEKRLGVFLQVLLGFESLGAIGAYKERTYNVYINDNGRVYKIETLYSFLKQIKT